MSDEETVPLLPSLQQQEQEPRQAYSSRQKLNLRHWLRDEWPILRILIAAFLWSITKFGATGQIIAFYRIFVCSEYYYRHPELSSESSSQALCSIEAVEARMSAVNLIVNLFSAAASAIGLLFFTPLLSKGRKKVLMLGIFGCALISLPFMVLPVGYPFSDQQQILSSEKTLIAFMAITIVVYFLAPESLPLLSCRVLLNDRSSPQKRTRNLNVSVLCSEMGTSTWFKWLTISYLSGLSISPGLVSGLCKLLPSLSASSIDHELLKIGSQAKAHHPFQSSADPRDTDIMPFIVVFVFGILAILWTFFVIPETAGLRELEDKGTSDPIPESKKTKSSRYLAALSILAPKRSQTSSTSDWRLLQIAATAQLAASAGLCLDSLIFFVGYSLKFSPTQVSFFISSVGTSRTIVLFLVVPGLLAYLARTTKKPPELAALTQEELERISKNPIEVESEIEREEELEENLENQDENARASQIYRDHRELLRLQEQVEEDAKLRHTLSMWRAQVDFKLLKFSLLFDLLGWSVTAGGGQLLSSSLVLLGGVMLALGAGFPAALYSVGVAIAMDMHYRGMGMGGTAQDAADAFMGAMSLLDSFSRVLMPATYALIYRASLDSILPGAPFFFAALLCLMSFTLILSFKSDGRRAS